MLMNMSMINDIQHQENNLIGCTNCDNISIRRLDHLLDIELVNPCRSFCSNWQHTYGCNRIWRDVDNAHAAGANTVPYDHGYNDIMHTISLSIKRWCLFAKAYILVQVKKYVRDKTATRRTRGGVIMYQFQVEEEDITIMLPYLRGNLNVSYIGVDMNGVTSRSWNIQDVYRSC